MVKSLPKVSVIVATYSPGDAISRLIDSLDGQTLPQQEFEVVLVDDGSPDDTVKRLKRIARKRSNYQVFAIPPSGWPSRPRNHGVDMARGEYVFFMDHDDALYPDALRRTLEFARENSSDVVNIQEYNTKHVWWMQRIAGNIPNALTAGGIDQLMPFMPHKLYRRQLLLDHPDIRFPERPRALWEDWYINVGYYRYSSVVSVLADTPVYLRHIHGANTSNTFDPTRSDYWERLDDIMKYIDKTLVGPEFKSARSVALARHVILRILAPLGNVATKAKPDVIEATFRQAERLLAEYGSEDVLKLLSKTHRTQSILLRSGQPDLMRKFQADDKVLRAKTEVSELRWQDGRLIADFTCTWESSTSQPVFLRDGEKIFRAVDPDLKAAIPSELLDITAEASRLAVNVRVRNRRDYTSYDVPVEYSERAFGEDDAGKLFLFARGQLVLDVNTASYGRPLTPDVWDFRVRTTWRGMGREGNPRYAGRPRAMLNGTQPCVAYSNTSRELSLDLAHQLRTLAVDAAPRGGSAGPASGFSTPLDNLEMFGVNVDTDAKLYAIPMQVRPDEGDRRGGERRIEALAAQGDLRAKVVPTPTGANLVGGADLASGVYRLYSRLDGRLKATNLSLAVDQTGQASFARIDR